MHRLRAGWCVSTAPSEAPVLGWCWGWGEHRNIPGEAAVPEWVRSGVEQWQEDAGKVRKGCASRHIAVCFKVWAVSVCSALQTRA